jgi:Cof subfamily protein (haloacid dehalogenase superfamily)
MLKAQIKMLVTDLDNTLLRTDKTISDYTAQVLNQCREQNIKTAFATARPKRTVDLFFQKIPVDCLALHNGAVIYVGNEQIFYRGIPHDTAKNILICLTRDFPEATLSVEIDNVLYANFDNFDSAWEYTFSDFTDLPDKLAEKILIGNIFENSNIKYIEKYLTDNLYMERTSTDHKLIMIMNHEGTKHSAVKILADYYGYNLSEIAAFGDDYNDVEMLRECGTGIAVANAIDEAKAVADYICESNDEDGVAKWIEKHILCGG